MAFCLTAPSPCLKQCWLIIKSVLWHSPENNFTRIGHELNPYHELENFAFEIPATSPRGQRVNFVRGEPRIWTPLKHGLSDVIIQWKLLVPNDIMRWPVWIDLNNLSFIMSAPRLKITCRIFVSRSHTNIILTMGKNRSLWHEWGTMCSVLLFTNAQ